MASVTDKSNGGSSPRLRGLDSNPQGAFGPRMWQAFRDTVRHIYDTVSLPDPSNPSQGHPNVALTFPYSAPPL